MPRVQYLARDSGEGFPRSGFLAPDSVGDFPSVRINYATQIQSMIKVTKFKVLLYLKKGSTDKRGKAPIQGRITLNNSMVQFSCKLSCTPNLWNPRSGMTSKSAFFKARIFSEPFHVTTFNKSQHEYYTRLSDFHAQFRMVGNNYNQTLKELKGHFSECRAMALVCKLEIYMIQLVQTMHKVTELTDENREIQAEK